jgi:glycosyltransferase involved in cell wall biosynthesis
MNSLISVIIPVYNGGLYLGAAIDSILVQNYQPIEILIIDDGSTDNTAKVAERFWQHVRYIYQPNSGAPSARNLGLKMAAGEIIAFLDADDIWHEQKLTLQLDIFAKNPSVEIVLGQRQRIHSIDLINGVTQSPSNISPELVLSLGTSLFRKSVFDTVGDFDRDLKFSDDWDWFMRARELGIEIAICPTTVLFYRRHDRNITNQIELSNKDILKMLKQSLDRRRQQNHGVANFLPEISNC